MKCLLCNQLRANNSVLLSRLHTFHRSASEQMAPRTRSRTLAVKSQIPLIYRIFFLYIEPVSTIVGAYYAHFQPSQYLHLTHSLSHPSLAAAIPVGVTTVLSQLANLYVLFAVNEALVLRSTNDVNVWRTLLFGLLVADFGHLASVRLTGTPWEVYAQFWTWNEMAWGNVGFVYLGALLRTCFISGIGLGK